MATDYKFKGQLTEAADSCARNVAEGFARYGPGDFARFLDISRGSATEVRACLKIARDSGYISDGEFNRLDELARRGLEAVAKFQRYLRSEEARRNASVHRYTRPPRANSSND